MIAQALLLEARKGDVRAISELPNRIERKPAQAIAVDLDAGEALAEAIAEGRKRAAEMNDRNRH